ncbi:MAG TPA: RodZ domain-containing protein [Terriglobales bacterium]|nr:RodZ domain-containing protein [Terriglobales bacterium]
MGEATPARAVPDEKPRISSFGERLRREREKRDISLDDVSVSTKISIRMLRALEEEKFDQLPGGIFNKGFVRAYARHLGIDEEQAVDDYLEAAGISAPPVPPEPVIESPPPPPKHQKESRNFEVPWGTLAILLLVAALGISLWSYRTREANTGSAETPAAAPAQPPTPAPLAHSIPSDAATPNSSSPGAPVAGPPAPKPVIPGAPANGSATPNRVTLGAPSPLSPGLNSALVSPPGSSQPPSTTPVSVPPLDSKSQTVTSPVAGNSIKNSGLLSPDAKPVAHPAAPAPTPLTTFVLLIEAQENSWVSITADGKTILEGTLIAPAVKAVRAQKLITVRTGNAGGLDFSLNGKKLPPQGAPGEAKTLTFSPAGQNDPASNPPAQ